MTLKIIPTIASAMLLVSCAHFSDIEEFPEAYQKRLARHPSWLTITSFDNAPGVFPPAETSVIKKWEMNEFDDGSVGLQETTSSSFLGLMEAIRRDQEPRHDLDLSDDVEVAAFFPYPGHALDKRLRFKSDRYEFREIDATRFEVKINTKGRIIFVPAPNNYFVAGNPYDVRDVGIWTAPFGAESELVSHLGNLLQKGEKSDLPKELRPSYFLHHDITIERRIPVYVDLSFPKPLRIAVVHATARWNKAIGRDLFRVERKAKAINPADCLSGRMLCIRWLGAPDLALTGANGYTELAFDPETGLIVGGLVSVINDDVKPPLKPLPGADKRGLARLDRDWVADAMHRYNQMNDFSHPEPSRYIEYLVMHEMGHFNGLGHNFYTTASTSPERPVSSVMTYPPFPVAHRANYIGEADMKRLAIVYGQKPPDQDISYCSTFDAMAPERDQRGYYKKPASCDMFTVGDAGDWYLRLARRGKLGVFTPFPDISHLSEELQTLYRELANQRRLPPLNVLTRLGFILADDAKDNAKRRERISSYLCELAAERRAIEAQLKTFHDVSLVCKAPALAVKKP